MRIFFKELARKKKNMHFLNVTFVLCGLFSFESHSAYESFNYYLIQKRSLYDYIQNLKEKFTQQNFNAALEAYSFLLNTYQKDIHFETLKNICQQNLSEEEISGLFACYKQEYDSLFWRFDQDGFWKPPFKNSLNSAQRENILKNQMEVLREIKENF